MGLLNTGISEVVEDDVILLVAAHELLGIEVADGKLTMLEENGIFDRFWVRSGVLPCDFAKLAANFHHTGLQTLPKIKAKALKIFKHQFFHSYALILWTFFRFRVVFIFCLVSNIMLHFELCLFLINILASRANKLCEFGLVEKLLDEL